MDVLAIIHSMYCEELIEQLWAGLDGFSFAELIYNSVTEGFYKIIT